MSVQQKEKKVKKEKKNTKNKETRFLQTCESKIRRLVEKTTPVNTKKLLRYVVNVFNGKHPRFCFTVVFEIIFITPKKPTIFDNYCQPILSPDIPAARRGFTKCVLHVLI